MRVLHLLPCRFWGGPEKQTLQLVLWLRKHRQVDSFIAVIPPAAGSIENPLLMRAREANIEATLFVQKRRYDVLEGFRVLRALVASYRPDVVCATGYRAGVLAARLRDVPSVAVARGWTSENVKVRLFEWLDRKTLKRHDAVIAVSKMLREQAILEGVAPQKVFWVPNVVDLDQLPAPLPREVLCAEIGADLQEPIIGAVGRLSPEKGHTTLLNAFCTLRQKLPRARLVLVGDGPEELALRRQTERLGLSGSVAFLGLRQDGQQIVGALDVMALPSLSEGMPNVVLEAFAYGTPVVATAVGGVPDLVSESGTGWLVPAGDEAKMSEALTEALERRQDAERRARRARSLLSTTFTPEEQARAWLRAIEAAIAPD